MGRYSAVENRLEAVASLLGRYAMELSKTAVEVIISSDMRGIQAILIVISSLVVVPALCMGGVITHVCECDEAPLSGTHSEDEHEHDSDSGCGHESDCADDPCENLVVRLDRHADDVTADLQSPVPCELLPVLAIVHGDIQAVRINDFGLPPSKHLPFPISDIPLLI